MAEVSEVWGPPFTDRRSAVQKFNEVVHAHPDKIGIICTHQRPSLYNIHSAPLTESETPYLRWTLRSLKQAVERLKAGLRARGIEKDSAIVTLLPNCAEFAVTWWAALGLDAIIAPLDPRNLTNREEVDHMLKIIASATSGKVAVVAFEEKFSRFDFSASIPVAEKIMVKLEGIPEGWTPFEQLMEAGDEMHDGSVGSWPDQVILFTSGSTSRPKGVKWQYPMHLHASADWVGMLPAELRIGPGDLLCGAAPNNHGIGVATMCNAHLYGAGVVYSGPFFSVEETAMSLHRERCTHGWWVPSIVELLADVMNGPAPYLKFISLGGTLVPQSTFQLCIDAIGARAVASGYGLTEIIATSVLPTTDPSTLFDEQGRVSVGPPLVGRAIKICDPESRDKKPLPCGVVGEICMAGLLPEPTVYIGMEDAPDIIHVDGKGVRWFATGDQGLIDAAGELRMLGRYKDLIKRGGEGLAPAAIEMRLAGNAKLAAVEALVVGAPDALAGEVPVAIVKGRTGPVANLQSIAEEIHRCIREEMGPLWTPKRVVSLQSLGLSDWPRTSVGKVTKIALKKVVKAYLDDQASMALSHGAANSKHNGQQALRQELLAIWSRNVGLEEDSIPLNVPISDFTDSLITASVKRAIRRVTPAVASVTVKEMQNLTIAELIDLIASRTDTDQPSLSSMNGHRECHAKGPPTAADMIHLAGKPADYQPTVDLIESTLERHGFGWADVESVFPVQKFVSELTQRGILDSGKFIFSFLTQERDMERVRHAIKLILRHNSILSSFIVWDSEGKTDLDPNLALHVTLQHNQKLFDHVLQDGGVLATVDELRGLAAKHPHAEWTLAPGMLCRVLLYQVEETGTIGFLLSVSHIVMDASFQQSYQADLDRVLSGQALQPHAEYKLWAEMYYCLRTSPQARASVKWHATYLANIASHFQPNKSIWPPTVKRTRFDPTDPTYPPGVGRVFSVPDIVALRKQHRAVSPPVILKTALALVNILRTGANHAVFANVQAGRTAWPFMPASMTDARTGVAGGMFSEGTDVAGPLLQAVVNLIHVKPDETALELLSRLQGEQDALTAHAHAPWSDIEAELDARSGGGAVHNGIMSRVFTTQILNWVPGMGAQGAGMKARYRNLQSLGTVTRWQVGVIVRAGVAGVNNDTVSLNLVGDGLDMSQKEVLIEDLEKMVRWLTKPENWNVPIHASYTTVK